MPSRTSRQLRRHSDDGGQYRISRSRDDEYKDIESDYCDSDEPYRPNAPRYPIYPRGRQWFDDNYMYRNGGRVLRGAAQPEYYSGEDWADWNEPEPRTRARGRSAPILKRLKNFLSRSRRQRSPGGGSTSASWTTSSRTSRSCESELSSRGRSSRSGSRDHGSRRWASPSPDSVARLRHALCAGLTAGAIEAIRVRRAPGEWSGSKGRRVATAALSAAAIEAAIDKHPDQDQKKKAIASRVGGLLLSRLINGPARR